MDLNELNKKLRGSSKTIYSEILGSSKIGNIKDYIKSDFYDLNRIATGNLFNFVPTGKIIAIAAPEGTGKSIILMNLIKNAQKQGYQIISCETEGSWDKEWCKRWGVDVSNISYNYMTTIEDFRAFSENFEKICQEKDKNTKFFWTLDSLGGLTLSKASEVKAGRVYIDQGLLQRHIKEAFKLVQRICNLYDIAFVFTNHFIGNPNAGLFQTVEEMCLISNTLLLLENGSLEKIQNVQVGQKVMTLEGPQEVVRNIKRKVNKLIKLTLSDNSEIIATSDHKVLVEDLETKDLVWKEIKEINLEDNIVKFDYETKSNS